MAESRLPLGRDCARHYSSPQWGDVRGHRLGSGLRSPLRALSEIAQDDLSVQAGWVGGSLARGGADEWSDIDLHLLVTDVAGFSEQLLAWFQRALPVALADAIPGLERSYLFITPDWIHVDVNLHDTAGFTQDLALPARVLFAKDSRVRTVVPTTGGMRGGPYLPARHPSLFLYFMGAAVTQARRGEWVALANNAARLRDSLLVPLMLAENGVRKSDGANRLNEYLTSGPAHRPRRAARDRDRSRRPSQGPRRDRGGVPSPEIACW